MTIHSWGRVCQARHHIHRLNWRCDTLPQSNSTLLPYAQGRSYGDVCLNDGGEALVTHNLKRLIHFDRQHGVLRAEAGVTLAEILQLIVPTGWFLPVTPGTQFVSLGGAIANDVHGKNHHQVGTFGRHVRCFELLRSDGERLLCSAAENPNWFRASVAGLGLTGLITWAEIQLIPVNNPLINEEVIRFGNVDEFFELSRESAENFDYTVSWLDCMASGKNLGRGLFMRGNHAPPQWPLKYKQTPPGGWRIPFDFPHIALNHWSIWGFNQLYYHKQLRKFSQHVVHYEPFFYPLDGLTDWNKIYGKRGFFQHQCVVPHEDKAVIKDILKTIAASGLGSFLAVLKVFGDVPSPGMMSFPRPGVTLALDFPNHGEQTLTLFKKLDALVRDSKGAIYPAKDANMSGTHFRQFYPSWEKFSEFIDPQFSSSFWRRVMEES
jgi:FAD/FMN-containing dehydrogenase